jgi:NAD-dependent deacetylase
MLFFGEMLLIYLEESLELIQVTDLLLVFGSSLQVSPANILPDIALRGGAKLVIVNLTPTPYDDEATLMVRHKVGDFASLALQYLESEISP